jgi:hypothetical protein
LREIQYRCLVITGSGLVLCNPDAERAICLTTEAEIPLVIARPRMKFFRSASMPCLLLTDCASREQALVKDNAEALKKTISG